MVSINIFSKNFATDNREIRENYWVPQAYKPKWNQINGMVTTIGTITLFSLSIYSILVISVGQTAGQEQKKKWRHPKIDYSCSYLGINAEYS